MTWTIYAMQTQILIPAAEANTSNVDSFNNSEESESINCVLS